MASKEELSMSSPFFERIIKDIETRNKKARQENSSKYKANYAIFI